MFILDAKTLKNLEHSILFKDTVQAAMDFEQLVSDHWDLDDYKEFLEKITWLFSVQFEAAEKRGQEKA